MNERFVSYADFGAKGDGVTNDFFAIKAAHEYANKKGLPVRAGAQKTFLISDTEKEGVSTPIVVKTDTDFCGSTIVIDDTNVLGRTDGMWGNVDKNGAIFLIESMYAPVRINEEYITAINESGGISRENTKKLNTGLGYPAMLVVRNDEEKVYIRYGGNEDSGFSKEELVVVDENGNIDETTPWLFDYKKITSITAYRIDEPTLTFENVFVLTKASQVNLVDKYNEINRGIWISRPNTHVRNFEHKVINEIYKGELQNGVPFIGHSSYFFTVDRTHNVLVENSVFQARVYYLQGTYDFTASMVNALTFKNCNQNNFFSHDDPQRPLKPSFGKWWGVAGTNFCKNLVYDSCRFTRYDAHRGVVNGAVKNCEISSIRLIGGGDMLIENCKIYQNSQSTLQLREDYGCTFRGTVTVKDSEFVDVCGLHSAFMVAQSSNWNYGYTTYFPNLIIDNVKVREDIKELPLLLEFEMETDKYGYFYRSVRDENIAVAGAICCDGKVNVNPYIPPEFIKVINNKKNGYVITVPDVPFFKNTELVGVKIVK